MVTGGAGFIGSNLVIRWLRSHSENIVNLDKLTYAGRLSSVAPAAEWIAPDFPPGWFMTGPYREHPVGLFVPAALLARVGYPADQAAYVERFVLEGQSSRLSAAAMETLAIVAYKQPISRAQVGAIRGVNVDGVMRTLQQRAIARAG